MSLLLSIASLTHPIADVTQRRDAQRKLALRLAEKLTGLAGLSIHHHPDGKPFLSIDNVGQQTSQSLFDISISHTGLFVAVLLARNARCGVDVELRSSKAPRLLARYADHNELALINASEVEKDLLAHLLWSAKEAAYKVFSPEDGEMINRFRLIELNIEPRAETGMLLICCTLPGKDAFALAVSCRITSEYVLCWAQHPG